MLRRRHPSDETIRIGEAHRQLTYPQWKPQATTTRSGLNRHAHEAFARPIDQPQAAPPVHAPSQDRAVHARHLRYRRPRHLRRESPSRETHSNGDAIVVESNRGVPRSEQHRQHQHLDERVVRELKLDGLHAPTLWPSYGPFVSAESDALFEPSTDELLDNNAQYVETFADHDLALQPRRKLAIVACMDSRMDIFEMLGLAHGDAHIIRNAGGIVTDDVIRSLVLSQRLLGTREIILLHHTDCGMQRLLGDTLKDDIESETGIRPGWAFEGFKDPYQNVRQSIRRLQVNPFIQYKVHIRGFVYRVEDGHLEETSP
ncbi:MAG: carbonic anhydrase [Ilumatobacteraceae bacterium]|nr:carbonic anhydrase [Ilumatobacteraceae bacterium]